MQFGKHLSQLLRAERITQQELAEDISIAPSTVSGYIQGTRQPDYKTIIRLAHYFDTTTDFLLGATRIKDTKGNYLSDEEAQLIDLYRFMDENGQEFLLEQARLIWCFYKHQAPVTVNQANFAANYLEATDACDTTENVTDV